MKVEVICSDNRINDLLQVTPMTYEQALSRALIKINKDDIPSSWNLGLALKPTANQRIFLDYQRINFSDLSKALAGRFTAATDNKS